MTTADHNTFWHRESYERLMLDHLPALLAERVPLAGYSATVAADHSWQVRVSLRSGSGDAGDIALQCDALPGPDDDGVFALEHGAAVVLPVAASDDLSQGVACVGEQLLAYVSSQLGEAPADMAWNAGTAQAWLPLARWFEAFLSRTAQPLDSVNALARATHLRRILMPGPTGDPYSTWQPRWRGLLCPFEAPEGRNLGKIRTIAVGAAIRVDSVVVVDGAPAAALGLSASLVPLIEHDDANRVLMGVNMMRQALPPSTPEPALVQSGREGGDDAPWLGCNLLTAFVSLGGDTYEDGIVLSASAAAKLDLPHAVEAGDKLSNRHGQKGVVARIVSDSEMPTLADGTPVELALSFIGCHTRLNHGQVREAVLGRIAHAKGQPVVVPPFEGPDDAALQSMLRDAGLPESGMEMLLDSASGEAFDRATTVGYVYWFRLHHLAARKLHFAVTADDGRPQLIGPPEYDGLKLAGAMAVARDLFQLCRADRVDADTLADRLAQGDIDTAAEDPAALERLAASLRVAGISVARNERGIAFAESTPADGIDLAEAVAHPWHPGRTIERVGDASGQRGWGDLVAANQHLGQLQRHGAPASMRASAQAELRRTLAVVLDSLFDPEDFAATNSLQPCARVYMSGRSVVAPGTGLRSNQLGLPDVMAWALFGPLAAREVGVEAIEARTAEAAAALDRCMAEAWVVLNRRPTWSPVSLLAFHAVRVPGHAIRLSQIACRAMVCDFDGDQAAVFMPVSAAARAEAGEKLSIVGHVTRDRGLIELFVPQHEAMWALAAHARTQAGRDAIEAAVGGAVVVQSSALTRDALVDAVRRVVEREGADAAVNACESLTEMGFAVVRKSGASISPCCAQAVDRTPAPDTDNAKAWLAHREMLAERIAATADVDDAGLGPQLLAVRSGARGTTEHLVTLAGTCGATVADQAQTLVAAPRCMAEGLSADECMTRVVVAQARLAEVMRATASPPRLEAATESGWSVVARAMRAKRPGVVFANAAAQGEVDPLTDPDVRMLLGMP